MGKEIKIEDGKIKRRYTKEWLDSGIIRNKSIPKLVESIVKQQYEMVEYIESLQDEIDALMEVVNNSARNKN